jgi:hypothetical protein
MPITTKDNLYNVLCQTVETVTGRLCWSKKGIQASPIKGYATVWISEDEGQTHDIVETEHLATNDAGTSFREIVWGACKLSVEVEFYRDTENTAATAATMMKNGLQRSARNDDLWQVCSLVGPIQVTDMTTIFRQDTESRYKLRFGLYANIVDPTSLPVETDIFDIHSQEIDLYRIDSSTDSNLIIKKTITGP